MRKQLWVAIPMFVMVWSGAGCDGPPEETSAADAGTPFFVDAEMIVDAGAVGEDAGALDDVPPPVDAGPEDTPIDAGADAGMPDGGPPRRCIGNYAEGVAIFAAESFLVLRAHVDPEETAEITAWPWQTSLGSVRPVALDVTWRTAGDPVFITEPLTDPLERRLRVRVTGDAFDMGGAEPYLTVQACVTNRCPAAAADGSPCSCTPEVCSPLILAAAVPALDGRWTFSEDGAETGDFDIRQYGRVLSGLPYDFPFHIDGVAVEGAELGILVTGAIAADRRSINGLRFTEDGDVIGPWSARRAD